MKPFLLFALDFLADGVVGVIVNIILVLFGDQDGVRISRTDKGNYKAIRQSILVEFIYKR